MVLNESYTGQDAQLLINRTGQNTEIPITNVTVDVETSTTEVQHNDDLTVKNVATSTTISGSFEYEGLNVEVLQDLVPSRSSGNTTNKLSRIGTIVLREGDGTLSGSSSGLVNANADRKIFLEGVQITSISRDVPGDDVASTSVDFVADEVNVLDGGNSVGQ